MGFILEDGNRIPNQEYRWESISHRIESMGIIFPSICLKGNRFLSIKLMGVRFPSIQIDGNLSPIDKFVLKFQEV